MLHHGLLSWWIRSELADDMRWLLKYYSVVYGKHRKKKKSVSSHPVQPDDVWISNFTTRLCLDQFHTEQTKQFIFFFYPYNSLLFKCILGQTNEVAKVLLDYSATVVWSIALTQTSNKVNIHELAYDGLVKMFGI